MSPKRKANGKADRPLRFAALIRVSTERQEQQGESLRTQDGQIVAAVKQLGGRVVKRYAGQEHATSGWEREQLDQLLADAEKPRRPFDAVIVADASRWSRDNVQSETGLDRLKEAGVAFFVGTTEHDLYNPEARLYLSLSASIGSYQAGIQSKKSLENRIERAKRGLPTCGKLPYGRTFDRESGKWGIDPGIQRMMQDVAARYLAGESMAELAREYGINHSFLHKTLMAGCGTVWAQRFRSAKLGIDETVQTVVPALLEPVIIAAVQRRAKANKTYSHGSLKHRYLLSRMVFCGTCGYAMSGQTNPRGERYYRHQTRNGANDCPLPFRPWVPADVLEEQVLEQLADFWGNPKAVEKALADAEPNRREAERSRQRLARIKEELSKATKARGRILDMIDRDTLTDEQAEKKLSELAEREVNLSEEAERLQAKLAGTLSSSDRKRLAKQVVEARRRAGSKRRDARQTATDPGRMSWEQKRTLVEDVFGGVTPDGLRMGIYCTPIDVEPGQKHRRWRYEARGKVELSGVVGGDNETNSSRHSPGTGPPARRSWPPPLRPLG